MSVFDLQQIIESTPVKEIDFHETLASTNDRALESIKNGQLEFPMLVLTDQQIAGRGQGNRKWLASPGSLTFSLCLTHPTTGTSTPLQSLLPLTIGLAVCQTIENLTNLKQVQLKWPNDLLIGCRKCGGILIESHATAARTIAVIGVGLNVNNTVDLQQLANLPGSQADDFLAPTSLCDEIGSTLNLNHFIIQLLNKIFGQLKQLPTEIVAQCSHRLFLREKLVTVALPGDNTVTGICVGLGAGGELVVDSQAGRREIVSGRIRIPPSS